MLEYLRSKYKETNFPFFLVPKLKYKGVFNREEANRLFIEGVIRKRDGMHGSIIELIKKEPPKETP